MKRIAAFVFGMLAVLAFAGPAAAAYPDRNVTIIVPYPAGGPTDQLARIIAEKLAKKFGQNFIVENVTGGSTIIASNKVAKAEPDGYTLLLHNLQISANPTLFKSLPFDTLKDFKTVIMINRNPLVWVGRPGLPANSFKEFMALMKTQRLKEALPGFGTTGHLTSRLFAQVTGLKFDEIPYRGGVPAATGIASGDVPIGAVTPSSAAPFLESGKLRVVSLMTRQKPSFAAAWPTLAEQGLAVDAQLWVGLFARAHTPTAIIDKLDAEVARILEDPDVRKQLNALGTEAAGLSQAAFAARIRADAERYARVIRDAGIRIER